MIPVACLCHLLNLDSWQHIAQRGARAILRLQRFMDGDMEPDSEEEEEEEGEEGEEAEEDGSPIKFRKHNTGKRVVATRKFKGEMRDILAGLEKDEEGEVNRSRLQISADAEGVVNEAMTLALGRMCKRMRHFAVEGGLRTVMIRNFEVGLRQLLLRLDDDQRVNELIEGSRAAIASVSRK